MKYDDPLHLQKFLREASSLGGSRAQSGTEMGLTALRDLYQIKARRHTRYPNLVLFKYEQNETTPFHLPIVQEARGIILNEHEGWDVVSRAFDKFFNQGEANAHPIEWETARVQEKLDGTLISLYHYADEWHVATSSVPDALGNVNGTSTFANYFWETFKAEGGIVPVDFKHVTFVFELMGPLNRQVVVHERPSLRLLTARVRTHLHGPAELPVEEMATYLNIPEVRSFPLQSLEEIRATFETMSPMTQEGYVVVDGLCRRIKVKHPGYVALHHAKDGLGPRAFVQICQTGETPEVVSAFPELQGPIDQMRARYEALLGQICETFERLRELPTQKEFAAKALLFSFQGVLFKMRRDGADARTVLATFPPDKVLELLDGKKLLAQR
jgi:hypothetical protein